MRVFIILMSIQFHCLLSIFNGYGGRPTRGVDICDHLRYFLHVAMSKRVIALTALINHGQVGIHAPWTARTVAARSHFARGQSLLARYTILLGQGLIAGERLHSGHGGSHVLDLEEFF